jgi:hypothetical protein
LSVYTTVCRPVDRAAASKNSQSDQGVKGCDEGLPGVTMV